MLPAQARYLAVHRVALRNIDQVDDDLILAHVARQGFEDLRSPGAPRARGSNHHRLGQYSAAPRGARQGNGLVLVASSEADMSAGVNLHSGGAFFRFLGNLLSPDGDRGRLSILIY